MTLRAIVWLLLIFHTSSSCPDECSCYESTIDCSFRYLASVPRDLPADTEWLRLDFNRLTSLSHTDFPNSYNLVRLCLNNNEIQSLSRGTFDNFPKLETLSLQENQLQSIPWGAFDQLSSLNFIRLYGNPWNCQQKEILYLSHWITTHEHKLFDEYEIVMCFEGLVQVKNVRELDSNVLANDSTVSPSNSATELNYASPADHFQCHFYGCHCKNETVDCTNKKYCTIPLGVPQTTKNLSMKLNSIKQLDANVFYRLQELQLLDLSYNVISAISNETFHGLINLQKLYMGFNKLKSLNDSLFIPLIRLKHLHLNNNHLKCLPHSVFHSLTELRFLDLSSNHLSVIHQGTFRSLRSLEGINLTVNVWNCKCKHILHLVNWMKTNSAKAISAPVICAHSHKHVLAVSHSHVSHHYCSTEDGAEDCSLNQNLHNSWNDKKANRNIIGANGGTLQTFSFRVMLIILILTQWARA